MSEVTSPLGTFGVNIVAETLADGPDSATSFAIGLVMVSRGHVEINLDISHKLLPKAGGETRVSICNLLLSIARFPEGDPAILKGQGGEASMEISTRDIIKMTD